MSKTFIDKPLAKAPTVKESIKLASETAGEEFDLELLQTLSLFKKWSEDNPGKSYDDFLYEFGLKKIELASGGVVESLEELYDAYEKGIDVMPGESVSDYIKRIRAAEADSNVDLKFGGLVCCNQSLLKRC